MGGFRGTRVGFCGDELLDILVEQGNCFLVFKKSCTGKVVQKTQRARQ